MNKIIVADDDLQTRTLMKHYLEKMGFEVLLESSGNNVARLVVRHRPVACIIDILMEGKEGVQTICELVDLPHRPKVIAFSQNPVFLQMVDGLGADVRLLKPVTFDTLQQTFQKLGITLPSAVNH